MRAAVIRTCPLSHSATTFQSHRLGRKVEATCRGERIGAMDATAGRLVYVGHATVLDRAGRRPLAGRTPSFAPGCGTSDGAWRSSHGPSSKGSTPLSSHTPIFDHFDRPSLRRLGTRRDGRRACGRSAARAGFHGCARGRRRRRGAHRQRDDPTRPTPSTRATESCSEVYALVSGSSSPARGSIYFAGDTDFSSRGCPALAGSIDIALLPVSGWGSKVGPGHLDPLRAAQSLRLLKPRLAIPIHWGTFSPLNRSTSVDPPEAFPPPCRRARARGSRSGFSIQARRWRF